VPRGAFKLLATSGTADTLAAAGIAVERVRKVTEEGTGATVVDLIRRGRCNLVDQHAARIGARTDGYLIREAALVARVPCITTLSGAAARARDRERAQRGVRVAAGTNRA
jgi:carbamoyl-phosphate synthase large subunit